MQVHIFVLYGVHNMGIRNLPDMYAQSPRAEGIAIHIRQIFDIENYFSFKILSYVI